MKDKPTLDKAVGMIDLVARSKGTYFAPSAVIKKIEVLAPDAVDTLQDLMLNSKADSVKLRAAIEILELAGVQKTTHLTIKQDVQDMSEKEINQRLTALMGTAVETIETTYEEVV